METEIDTDLYFLEVLQVFKIVIQGCFGEQPIVGSRSLLSSYDPLNYGSEDLLKDKK